MIGIDIDKMVKSIVHPFTEIMNVFTVQMDQLHKEVQETNKLLREIRDKEEE